MNDLNVCDLSLGFVEAQYARWVHDPQSVDGDWQRYFDGFEVDTDTRLRSVTGTSIGTPSLFDPDRPVSTDGEADDPTAMSATPDEAYALLRMLAVFREVPDDELEEVAGIVKELRFGDGDVVFRAGDPGNEMFVVLAGSVLVRRDRKVVAELEVGEVVGEMAVLDGLPRSADTVARGDVRLLRLNGDDLLGLLDRRPALARGILRTLTQRIRDSSARQDQVDQLIRAYRVRGHLIADLDPLGLAREPHPELDPEHYGFGPADMGRVFSSRTIPGTEFMTLDDILAHLRKVYCGSIGVQYMHIDDLDIKSWLQEQVEGPGHDRTLSREEQLHILTKLTDAEAFEQFIHRKFLGAKRFSLEGAESLIPLLDLAVEEAGAHGVEEIVIGMAHRGRLNVLANVLEKSPRQIFREFDDADADKMVGGGDVKYHLGYSSDRVTVHGDKVHLTLCFNPSHLEFVGPVVMGRVRSKQDRFRDYERRGRMGIVIHGDSAFAGQGVVQEMLNMGGLPGYTTGGTLHIIVNNQIGFTTPPQRARSTQYCTDVAKMLQVPIFHVNGEHPEAVARVIQLAMDFRQAFQRDVVVDMYCYRRYGHNETDEPAFTQPLMYEAIRKRKSVRDGYFENIEKLGELTKVDADRIAVERRQVLEDELTIARSDEFQPLTFEYGRGFWRRYHGGPEAGPIIDTSVPAETLRAVMTANSQVPDGFTPHRKIAALLKTRATMGAGERDLDWAAAEALAIGSLLAEGTKVRITGQDAGRGTFSHRHAVLWDNTNGEPCVPLRGAAEEGTTFEIHDSPLTETAVLGFEYGYSLDMPDALCVWEAQFGDFVNVAQVVIDQFLCSGEDKWRRLSALALLLPHGYEGQGPEHSSARLERFLALCAEDNMRVVNLTAPSQIFHCLRRQAVSRVKKPLIVMSPKSLLRHPKATSKLDALTDGRFQTIIEDDVPLDRAKVRRVLLTSGKIYYELAAHRAERGIDDVAIVRMEQYYPIDRPALAKACEGYADSTPVVWVQEEPLNMGAWSFLKLHHGDRIDRFGLSVIAREASASPATGSASAHKKEQAQLIERAFGE